MLQLLGSRVAMARGDLDDAARRLRAVRPGAGSPVATRLLEQEVRAELAAARGDTRRARAARPRRAGGPARVAVLVRQPRPAEHAGRPRPRPGARRDSGWPWTTAAPRWSSSGPSAPAPWSAGSRRCARRPTSGWPPTSPSSASLPGPGPRVGVPLRDGGPTSCASGSGSTAGTAPAVVRSASRWTLAIAPGGARGRRRRPGGPPRRRRPAHRASWSPARTRRSSSSATLSRAARPPRRAGRRPDHGGGPPHRRAGRRRPRLARAPGWSRSPSSS